MPARASGAEREHMGMMPSMKASASIRTVPQTRPLPSLPSGACTRFAAANLIVAASSRLAPYTTTSSPPSTPTASQNPRSAATLDAANKLRTPVATSLGMQRDVLFATT